MCADVIELAKWRPHSGTRNPEDHQKELARNRQELLANVRAVAENPNAKFERDGEIAAAQVVNKLIVQAKLRGIAQVDIERELRKSGRNIRKFDRLRENHELPPADIKKRPRKDPLVRKIQPYVFMLEALSRLLSQEPDDVIFDAFRETKFRRSQDCAVQVPGVDELSSMVPIDEPVAVLSWLLQEMAGSVSRSQSLIDYFEIIQKRGLVVDLSGEFALRPSDIPASECAYDYWYDLAGQVPVPAVPLIRVHRATLRGPLDVEKDPIAARKMSRADVAAQCEPSHRAPEMVQSEFDKFPARDYRGHVFGPTETIAAEITLSSDISLAVGPRSRPGDMGPLFQVTTHVELSTGGKPRDLTFDLSSFRLSARADVDLEFSDLDHYVGSVAACFESGWRRVAGFGKIGWELVAGAYATNNTSHLLDPTSPVGPLERDPDWFGMTLDGGIWFDPLLGPETPTGAEWSTYFVPLDPGSVSHFVQLLSQAEAEEWPPQLQLPLGWCWLSPRVGPYPPPEVFRFPSQGCRALETALHTGAIETALAAESQRLKRKLTEFQSKNDALLQQQTAALVARWRGEGER